MALITLTTDFGLSDEYVGVMKGVILSICPEANIVDLTHDIPPQNIRWAAYTIDASYHYFPEDTIHVIVVDPGVGSGRRIIALQTMNQVFLAPDNGILTQVLTEVEKKIYEVTATELFLPGLSNTFHGRDIFAPVAAHLARGVRPDQLGPRLQESQVERLKLPEIMLAENSLSGSVVYVDHFGNLITNLDRQSVSAFCKNNFDPIEIHIKDIRLRGISRSYTTEANQGPIAIFNSRDYLEIAIPMASAAEVLEIRLGEPVRLGIKGMPSS